jgi:hypothetical protein
MVENIIERCQGAWRSCSQMCSVGFHPHICTLWFILGLYHNACSNCDSRALSAVVMRKDVEEGGHSSI